MQKLPVAISVQISDDSDSNPDSRFFGLDSDSDWDSDLKKLNPDLENRGGFVRIRIRGAWIRIRDARIRTSLVQIKSNTVRFVVALPFLRGRAVLSAKSTTGGYAGIDRRPCINSEGGCSAPEAIESKMKTGRV